MALGSKLDPNLKDEVNINHARLKEAYVQSKAILTDVHDRIHKNRRKLTKEQVLAGHAAEGTDDAVLEGLKVLHSHTNAMAKIVDEPEVGEDGRTEEEAAAYVTPTSAFKPGITDESGKVLPKLPDAQNVNVNVNKEQE